MKQLYISMFLLLGWAAQTSAQQSSHFIPLNQFKWQPWQGAEKSALFHNKYYVLLESARAMNPAIRSNLAQRGIIINTNPLKNIYTASIPAHINLRMLSDLGFRNVYIIPPGFKLDQRLLQPEDQAAWAVSGKDIQLQLTFIPGSTYQEDLLQSGVVFLSGNRWKVALSDFMRLVQKPYILRIEPVTPELTNNNLPGKTLHGSAWMEQSINGFLTGKGVKVGEWDGGYVGKHIDFGVDKTTIDSLVYSDHATHVAGTIKSKGILNPYARGMAPDALLYSSDFYGDIEAEMDTLIGKEHIQITSNSYGYSPAYDPCGTKGSYDIEAQRTDSVAYKYPFLSHVFAATNSQTQCSGGYRTIGSGFNSAKNILSVGAVDYKGAMSSFSSWGPVYDGRLKPEVCGVGVNVYSTLNNDTYAGGYNGTSMATPGVSGTLAQLYEKYQNIYHSDPEASLFRAIICNTANDAGNAGPDYKFGFGILNGQAALYALDSALWLTDTISNGNLHSYQMVCPAGVSQMKVTAAWTDVPGDPQRSKSLVQDINIYLINPVGDTVRPWVLNPAIPSAAAVRSTDTLNNIEQVTLDAPISGTWKLMVAGTDLPAGTQTFAATWSLAPPQLKLTNPAGGEFLNSGDIVTIRWNAVNASTPYSLFYSLDSGLTWTTIAAAVSNNYFDWTVPSVSSRKVYIKVTDGSLMDSSENVFTIYSSVSGLTATACSNAVKLSWNAVGSVSRYYIYKLDYSSYAWTLVDSTLASKRTWVDYQAVNGTKYYYTVSPLGTSGAIGRKCLAVTAVPGASQSNLISNVGGTTLLCGDTITLTSVSGLSYSWSNGFTGRVQRITSAGSYAVATTMDSGCVAYSPAIQIRKGFSTSVLTDTVCQSDSIRMMAKSPQLITARFTEIIQNKAGTGAVSSYPSWMNGNSANADYAEISNMGDDTIQLDQLTFEQWNSNGIMSQFTWPSGTQFSPRQISVLHIGNTATNDTSRLFFNTGAADDQSVSGDARGYILRHSDGTIYDVVAVNGYTFPSNAGVSAFDWEPAVNMNSMQGRAGVGLNTADYNRSQEWYLAASGTPLTTGTYNSNLKTIPLGKVNWLYHGTSASGPNLKYIQNTAALSWKGTLTTATCQSTDSGSTYAFAPGFIQIQSNGHYRCQGDTIHLTTSQPGNYTYQWNATSGGHIIVNVDSAVDAMPSANSIYHLIQTDNVHGCVYQDSYVVNLYDTTLPSWNMAVKRICSGDSVMVGGQSDETNGWNKWELEVQFDASGSNLSGSQNVYIHSGLTDTAAVGSNWRQIRGHWGMNDGIGKMDSIGVDLWRTRLNLPSYFDVNSDSAFGALSFIFRNADGSVVANHNGDSIYINLNGSFLSSSWNAVTAHYIHQYQILHHGVVVAQSNQTSISDTGAYYLTDAAFQCSSDTSGALLIQWFSPSQKGTIKVSADSICAGDSVQMIHLGHGGTTTWEYYNGQQWNLLNQSGDSIWFLPAVSGLVRALATDSCQALYSDSIAISVLPALVSGKINLSNDSLCAGDTVAFSYSASNSNLQWSFMGASVSGKGWKPLQSGYLNLMIDGGICASIYDSAYISVFSLPQISKLYASQTAFCEGDSVMLSVDSFSNATLHWQYFDSLNTNQFLTFKNIDSLTIYTAGFDTLTFGGATYRVEAQSAQCGSVFSDTLSLLIYPKNRPGMVQLANDSVCPGYYNQLRYQPAGAAKWYNQHVTDWQFQNTSGQWVSAGTSADTLNYLVNYNTYIRAVFISGCDTQYLQKNILLKAHAISGNISVSKDSSCLGDTLIVTSSGHFGLVTWELDTGTGFTGMGQGDQLKLAVMQAGQIRARYIFGNCDTVYSGSLNIYMYPQPKAGTIGISRNNVCPGVALELYHNGYDGAGSWETFDSTTNQWKFIGSGDTLNIKVYSSAWYRTAVTKGSCGPVFSQAQLIQMIDGPVHGPLVADQNKVCVGKSVQLSTGSQVQGNFIWQEFSKGTGSWKNLPGAGNTEIVFPYDSSLYRAVISKNGCTDTTNAVWVTTLPSPTAGIAAAGNTTFCAGENVILNATTGNGYRYQWQKDTVTITGAMVSNLTVGAAGSYRVIVRLTNGCADTSGSVTIKVNPNPPVPVITRIGMTLDAGIPGFNYQWYDNNIPVPGANGQTFAMIKGGNYTVKVTNGFGCFMMSVPYNNSGLDQDEPVHSMEVYPNPSTGMFYITEKVSQVSIYDMTGREVQGGLGADANSFDLSACAPGMYQVYITKGQQKFTLKIIKYDR